MGFLGVLEDKHLQHVPATVILSEEQSRPTEATAGLKRGTGKDADIILIPQPSEDPNDPLNWPWQKKWTIMFIIAFGSTLYAAVLAPLLSPALVVIAMDFKVQVADITVISGYMLLVTAASGPIISALSRKYGKRFMLILSSLFGLVGTIVGSAVYSYDGLLAARIIQGGSISAFESLVVSMIGDLFFVHQRGLWMTLIQFILGAASNFSAIIVGPIATDLGWRYLFHILIAFAALEVFLLFFFVPETAYNRDHRYDIDELAEDNLQELAAAEKRHTQPSSIQKDTGSDEVVRMETAVSANPTYGPKKTFAQELALFSGTYSDDNLLQLMIAPFAVCLNLAVLWMVIVTGGLTAFFVAQSYDMAQIFMFPPYNLSAAGVGYLSLGPFLGGLLGSIVLGATLDPIIKWCAKHNGGIYEPEYRLLGMIPSLLTGVGLFAFGYMCENHFSYYATATMHGMDLFGIVCAAISASAYVIDAYRDMSSEIFIMNMLFKNLLFYGFSYFVNDWTAEAGPAVVFYTFGGIAFAMTCTTPFFFFWGKRYRSFWHRHNMLEKWGIRTHAEM
ncbi:MFS general substrate transporter [Aaosphaeria arxii CBS 175.79]|uniref:MFS general substrate transporter n=1 Tax=Aaosphaeria arxii CBS 175.79 TaxID=1450172 RepID=A0A6A5XXV9_9PLEO|nr:MFS general substrate transporter [Aaosphaeria arxii CBS 175.79]KAF2017470.1 MFS general substrate transporter [Aaosphaeria arxii CBS 175.79]